MTAALKPRCIQCHQPAHPPGCAYQGAAAGLHWDCPACASPSFRVLASSDGEGRPGRMQTSVIECECGAQWELLNMVTPVNQAAGAAA